jgi:hypothetical protein
MGIAAPRLWTDGRQDYNKNWKNQLRAAIRRGVEVEKGKFPRAAALFAGSDDKRVRTKAVEAYYDYLDRAGWLEAGQYLVSVGIGDDLLDGMPVDEEQEVNRALVQLGSCLENGIDPVP